MTARLEHANLTVRDVDGVIRFLRTAFPEFWVRRDVTDADGTRWVHVGTDETYIALFQAHETEPPMPSSGRAGFNHLGYEVDDASAVQQRLLAAGFARSGCAWKHPHRRRVYFHDPEGNEWEFVQYFADSQSERHDYDLPDVYEGQT